MNFITVKTKAEMAEIASDMIIKTVKEKPDAVLGLATGSTPLETYALLCEKHKKGLADFSGVRTVNLDEYVGLDVKSNQSYAWYMQNYFFGKVNISPENTHIPNGKAEDIPLECKSYDRIIEALGGTDLQILGIGHNGHIGFNEPADAFTYETHEVVLNPVTVKANARFFENENDVPRSAITMGMSGIMNSKKLLLLAGKDKKDILLKALSGEVTPHIPASLITEHRDLTVILCEE